MLYHNRILQAVPNHKTCECCDWEYSLDNRLGSWHRLSYYDRIKILKGRLVKKYKKSCPICEMIEGHPHKQAYWNWLQCVGLH